MCVIVRIYVKPVASDLHGVYVCYSKCRVVLNGAPKDPP